MQLSLSLDNPNFGRKMPSLVLPVIVSTALSTRLGCQAKRALDRTSVRVIGATVHVSSCLQPRLSPQLQVPAFSQPTPLANIHAWVTE